MEGVKSNHRKANANTENYVETQMGEKHGERNFTMSMMITGGDSLVSSSFWIPISFFVEGFFYIYKSYLLIRLISPA